MKNDQLELAAFNLRFKGRRASRTSRRLLKFAVHAMFFLLVLFSVGSNAILTAGCTDDAGTVVYEHFSGQRPPAAASGRNDARELPPLLLGEPFRGFQSMLYGPPDFLLSERPSVVRSGATIAAENSKIQAVVFDTNVTFLPAGNTGQSAISPVIDPPVPPAAAPGVNASAGGNVTVIPAQAVPAQAVPVETATGPTAPAQAAPQASPTVNPTAQAAPNPPLPAEASTSDAPAPAVTPEMIAAQRAAVELMPDLTDDAKTQLAKYFQRASETLTQKADIDKRYNDLKAEKDNGPALIAEQRTLLSQPPPKSEPEFPFGATVTELDQLRLVDEDRAAEARRNLETWEAKSKTRAEKKPQMPALIETTRKQLEEADKAVSATAPDGELPVLGAARRLQQQTQVMLLKSQLELYRIEQLRYEALNELFPLQRDVLTRIKSSADKRIELWKTTLADARQKESARQAEEALEKLRSAHPALRELAERNSKLTEQRSQLQETLRIKVEELTKANAKLAEIEDKFKTVVEKEKRAGLTTAIGLLLRNQRSRLPDPEVYHRLQQNAESEIVRLQTEQMPLEDERNSLGDIDAKVEESLKNLSPDDPEYDKLREMTVELCNDQKQYLGDLLSDYESCLQTLGETDVTCHRLESTISEFESYIDERVLWIRSAPAVDSGIFGNVLDEARSFVSNRQWRPLVRFAISDAQTYWPLYGLLFIGFLLLLVLNRRIRSKIADLGNTAGRQLDSGIPLTLAATGLTILMASSWPALLWFAGWRLSWSELNLASALSTAFTNCSVGLLLVDSFRKICRKNGVAESFLAWPQPIVRTLHASLLLYVVGCIPLIFIVITASNLGDGSNSDSLGRITFVSFCLVLAVMLRRIVRPTGAVIGDLLRSNPTSLMYRLRWLWYPLAVGSPLLLAMLALLGYEYTAEQLMLRVLLTLVLTIVLVITYTMVMQWMLAAKRNLAMKQARARRAAALAAAQREADESGTTASTTPPTELPQVDLSLLNQQMLQMVRGAACVLFLTFGWVIWGQVLPALQVFSRIELWSVIVETTTKTAITDSGNTVQEITRVEPVTLGHLLISIVVFSTAVLASRNLPGLLELAVLQRLPMDHGGRNAITTLCRYTFMVTGGIVACNTMGIHWSSVQWLVAALTVGLGFGLQEIFANFVSGLIILFERPVRIGDVVTIDGVSGSISRIQIRATTITDWDRKEYIVPNREFVTGKLLNWTLSDKTNRVVIKVGVAYGTDTEQALALLLQVAEEHPLILGDPAPVVGFEGFGESCLDIVLRCFLPNLDNRMKVITQLHIAIDRKFKAAGIEISFPQRDLHIRSLPPQFSLPGSNTVPQAESSVSVPTDETQQQRRSA